MKRRTIFIKDTMWERLSKLALRDGTNISELIRRAIIKFLREEE